MDTRKSGWPKTDEDDEFRALARELEESKAPCLKLYYNKNSGDVLTVLHVGDSDLFYPMLACAILSASDSYHLPVDVVLTRVQKVTRRMAKDEGRLLLNTEQAERAEDRVGFGILGDVRDEDFGTHCVLRTSPMENTACLATLLHRVAEKRDADVHDVLDELVAVVTGSEESEDETE